MNGQDWARWLDLREVTSLHGLSPAFAERLAGENSQPFEGSALNVRPDPIDFRDRYYEPPLIKLESFVPPPDLSRIGIRSQGAGSTCTGQALAAVIDLQNAMRGGGDPVGRSLGIPSRTSARMLYESARLFDEYPDDDLPGSSVRGAIKGFYHNGVCSEKSAPYRARQRRWQLTAAIAKEARTTSLGAYYRLRPIANHYHAALCEVGAVLCSAMIHDGWAREAVDKRAGKIRIAGKIRPERLVGAHAFAIVGYDRDGFLVLNSWGAEWGGFPIAPADLDGGATPRPGIAHWPYEDWQSHVLDAWVLRLSAPFAKTFGLIGGYVRPAARLPVPSEAELQEVPRASPTISRQNLVGHYIHLDNGRLVAGGPYPSPLASIVETANYLLAMDRWSRDKRYDHVLFYAHGGVTTRDDAIRHAARMAPAFKRNGIYPIFFVWRTGLGEALRDLITGMATNLWERTGFVDALKNRLLESVSRPIGRPVWNDMKDNAARCFKTAPGDGWRAMMPLLDALAQRQINPATLHFVGHSAGSILIGELFAKIRQANRRPNIGTVSLMAPACTVDFFSRNLEPVAAAAGPARCANFILTDRAERDDKVGPYSQSILYLVSNAFEALRPTHIAGMDRFWDESAWANWKTFTATPSSPDSRADTHTAFDSDRWTLNRILTRILGRTMNETNGGFTAADLR